MNDALGMVEARGLATAVTVADVMVKTADVKLLGVERAKGSGWVTVKVSGDVGAVKAAVDAGIAVGETCGDYIASKVIPRPIEAVQDFFMQEGQACDWDGDYENGTLRHIDAKPPTPSPAPEKETKEETKETKTTAKAEKTEEVKAEAKAEEVKAEAKTEEVKAAETEVKVEAKAEDIKPAVAETPKKEPEQVKIAEVKPKAKAKAKTSSKKSKKNKTEASVKADTVKKDNKK